MMKRMVTALAITALLAFPVAAEDGAMTQVVEFDADSPDAEYSDFFTETVTDSGIDYKLDNISYEVLEETPITEQETITYEIQSEPMYTQAMQPEQTVTVDGIEYTLKEVVYSDAAVTNRSVAVSAYTEWPDVVTEPVPPSSKTATYQDEATGRMETAELPFVELRRVSDLAWRENKDIPITFEVYNAAFYQIGNRYAPYNEDKPALDGYEADILGLVGLDTDLYTIDDISWAGEPYERGGVMYRDAVATGRKYCATYRAEYADTIQLADAPGYMGTAVYTAEQTVETGEMNYHIKATATYTPISAEIEPSELPIPIIAGTGAVVVVAGVFLLLWFSRSQVVVKQGGKTVYKTRVKHGMVYLDRVAKGGIHGTTVTIKKRYTHTHVGQAVQFIAGGKTVGSYIIRSRNDATLTL